MTPITAIIDPKNAVLVTYSPFIYPIICPNIGAVDNIA